ncbi:D-alanyl-D-alanine carboxypeptidase [Carnobacterium divergens]|uniref:serine-type D-Ala-D-Ala carboxypeptidase n=1 Tax=Carnobacterium divergens TaxID=2748 RepID=A0AAW8RA48_CARDV|nr:serine hydrolase [Carnobacterium divergens]MDT1958655.1 D-alanyl-D-alanine carboxypeptidase [Carnobacterium divergens]MDT1974535.1 D-alanyl-D-alanine carboxypeptidase [Carnobacterium divergens]
MKKLNKYGVIFAVALMIGTIFPSFLMGAQTASAAEAPEINAAAAFAIEAKTGKVLVNKNGDEKLGIASMTKMITEYLVLEAIKDGELKWDQKITIDDYSYKTSQNSELSNVPLRLGEQYTVKELYEAMAIYSANAAAISLAQAISGSEPQFVDAMREKVISWGAKAEDIYLINATGLTNSDLNGNLYPGSAETDENMMTARDMALVAQHLLNDHPEVIETAKIPTLDFRKGTSDEIHMENWNWMLPGLIYARDNVDGLKTGTTDIAGACFTGTAEENGMRIITVVMNAGDGETNKGARFEETAKIMDYAFDNFEMKELVKKGDTNKALKAINVAKGKEDSVKLVMDTNVNAIVQKDTEVKNLKVTYTEKEGLLNSDKELVAPIKKGMEVGTAQVAPTNDTLGYINGATGQEVKVVTASEVEKANFFVLTGREIKSFFTNLF